MSVYLVVRVLHILCGALWLGFAVFSAWFLMPAVEDAGPDAAKVMAGLERRGLTAAVPIVATITILAGIWLYWRYTAGFSPEVSRSHAGMTFGMGGVTGILAFIIGAATVSRNMVKARKLMMRAAGLPEGEERRGLMVAAARHRKTGRTATSVVAVLLVITVALMGVALYI